MHGAGKFGLTQLANVDKLPATGAVIVAAPLKIEHGSGSPVRVIAIAPGAEHVGNCTRKLDAPRVHAMRLDISTRRAVASPRLGLKYLRSHSGCRSKWPAASVATCLASECCSHGTCVAPGHRLLGVCSAAAVEGGALRRRPPGRSSPSISAARCPSSGRRPARVTVTVAQRRNRHGRSAVTDSAGLYLAALPPQGSWELSAELSVFGRGAARASGSRPTSSRSSTSRCSVGGVADRHGCRRAEVLDTGSASGRAPARRRTDSELPLSRARACRPGADGRRHLRRGLRGASRSDGLRR